MNSAQVASASATGGVEVASASEFGGASMSGGSGGGQDPPEWHGIFAELMCVYSGAVLLGVYIYVYIYTTPTFV